MYFLVVHIPYGLMKQLQGEFVAGFVRSNFRLLCGEESCCEVWSRSAECLACRGMPQGDTKQPSACSSRGACMIALALDLLPFRVGVPSFQGVGCPLLFLWSKRRHAASGECHGSIFY